MIANTIKRKLYGVSIKTKLFGGFSLLLILALIMGGYVVRTLKIFEEISYKKSERNMQLELVDKVKLINTTITLIAMDSIIDKSELKMQPERLAELNSLYDELKNIKPSIINISDTKEEKTLIQLIFTALDAIEPIIRKDLIFLIESGASDDAFAKMDDDIDNASGDLDDNIDKLFNLIKDELKEASQIEKEYSSDMYTSIISILILTILFGIFFATFISKNIFDSIKNLKNGLSEFFKYLNNETENIHELTASSEDEIGEMIESVNKNIKIIKEDIDSDKKVLEEVSKIVQDVSRGDLTGRISEQTKNPSVTLLTNELNFMMDELQNIVQSITSVLKTYENKDFTKKVELEVSSDIKGLTDGINNLGMSVSQLLVENLNTGLKLQNNANILTQNVTGLSKSSNEQASSLEETAASLEEITSSIINDTTNFNKMVNFSKTLSTSIEVGQKLAIQTVESMNDINNQTKSISEAIVIIDQIAFQTNILSLNAAVEAATAGEAGKGFAVVAAEVRNLASRSAEAAKQIKDLVEKASEKTHTGKSIADDMIVGYNLLKENNGKTTEIINVISDNAKEQQKGISQINDAVNALDQSTQHNASAANITQEIAQETFSMADEMVKEANISEFIGKK